MSSLLESVLSRYAGNLPEGDPVREALTSKMGGWDAIQTQVKVHILRNYPQFGPYAKTVAGIVQGQHAREMNVHEERLDPKVLDREIRDALFEELWEDVPVRVRLKLRGVDTPDPDADDSIITYLRETIQDEMFQRGYSLDKEIDRLIQVEVENPPERYKYVSGSLRELLAAEGLLEKEASVPMVTSSLFYRKVEEALSVFATASSKLFFRVGRGEFSGKTGLQITLLGIIPEDVPGSPLSEEPAMGDPTDELAKFFGAPVHQEGITEDTITYTVEFQRG